MKKKFLLPLIIIFAFLFFLGSLVWFTKASKPISNDKIEQRFVIERGSGASLVGANLQKAKLIRNAIAFKLYVQLTGKSAKIQAGEYSIPRNLSLIQLTDLLLEGPSEVWVTIPEGIRREEVVLKMADGLGLTGSARDKFIIDFLARSQGLEGYLFPDTYLLPRDIAANAVVNLMKSTFDQKINFKVDSQTLVLASILERETLAGEERPIVAGILLKRLAAGWALQADATVQYAVSSAQCLVPTASCDWWPRPLTEDDLKINSSYNTYKYPGLPPAPISNPGLATLQAVASPTDSPYWYYLHDPKGEIHYAATIEEHNANVAKYLR